MYRSVLPTLVSVDMHHYSYMATTKICVDLHFYKQNNNYVQIAGVNGQNSEVMCQGGKPGTGKLYTDVCLCCSAHTSGCVVDGLGATAAF